MSERFGTRLHDAATAIDVPDLDTGALLARGQRARARRRMTVAGAVAAVAAVLVVGSVAVPRFVDRADPAGGPAPATPHALAAIALDHVDGTPSSVTRSYPDEEMPGAVAADLRFRPGEGYDGDLLSVAAVPGRPAWVDGCGRSARCDRWETPEGALLLGWELEAPEEDPGTVFVVLQRADEYALAYQAGQAITGDPRDLDLRITVDQMVAIVGDERFGLTTTRAAVRDGRALGARMAQEDDSAEDAATGPITPRAVAAVTESVLGPGTSSRGLVGAEGYGPGVGAVVAYADGATVAVTVLEESGETALACPSGMRCVPVPARDGGELRLGWDDVGGWVLVHDRGTEVVRVEISGDDGRGDPRRRDGLVPYGLAQVLVEEPNLKPLVDAGALADAESLPSWQD